jgi:hypothetical protein
MNLRRTQAAIAEDGLDGWLLYDHRRTGAILHGAHPDGDPAS